MPSTVAPGMDHRLTSGSCTSTLQCLIQTFLENVPEDFGQEGTALAQKK